MCGALAFAVGVLLLNVLMDTTHPELRDPEFGPRSKRLTALARDGRPLVVFLGSSRTQMAVRPSVMFPDPSGPVGYNLGQAGAGPVQVRLNADRLLTSGVRPAAVLIEVMPPTLAQDVPAEDAFRDSVGRLTAADLGVLRPYCDDPAGLRRRWLAGRLNPWAEQRFVLLSHAAPWLLPWQQRVDFQWRDVQPDGWLPYPFDPTPDIRARGTAVARQNYEPTLASFRVAPRADRLVRDAIARCQAEGVRVGLYLLPEGESFRALYPPAARAAAADYLRRLSVEYAVPVFDATDWAPADADYADGHHMLKGPASVFSRRLGGECVRPWLGGGG